LKLQRTDSSKPFISSNHHSLEHFLTIIVNIPAALWQYTAKKSEVHLEATTVDEALAILNQQFPGLKSLLLDENSKVRPYVNIFVNEQSIRSSEGLLTGLKDGDHLHIIPSVAGGGN
jgi:adenylyltransferase/sulfurtransferase